MKSFKWKSFKLIPVLFFFLLLAFYALIPPYSHAAGGVLKFIEAYYDGTGLDGASSVTVSGDGKHVYVAGSRDDAVAVFSRDSSSGQLTFVEMLQDGVDGVDGLNGASSVTVSGDGKHVYVAGYDDNAVSVFSRDSSSGQLTFVEVLKDGVGSVDGLYGAGSVTVSSDGKHVYVAGEY
ncbi:MAG: beta-propeller fold lactonase family protein, partial [Anaerolineae bacterium]|nr:beta-propeller fold lactonase family protein [Anaerolineae bacterium]